MSPRLFLRLVPMLLMGSFLVATLLNAQGVHSLPTQIPQHDAIVVGAAWYPEQWPESRWEEDLKLMEAANIKMARIAEFAWSALEPSEGRYEMDWLERAVAAAAKHHIVSVI